MTNEKQRSATAFLKRSLAYYESLGVKIERVMTDNGSCYKSFTFRRACKRLGLKHIRTKPYSPKTNGKAERFIQTALREWAYAQAYHHSDQRLACWLASNNMTMQGNSMIIKLNAANAATTAAPRNSKIRGYADYWRGAEVDRNQLAAPLPDCHSSAGQFMAFGSHSEICGKPISNAMMTTSQARNQKQPSKIFSSEMVSPTTLLTT